MMTTEADGVAQTTIDATRSEAESGCTDEADMSESRYSVEGQE